LCLLCLLTLFVSSCESGRGVTNASLCRDLQFVELDDHEIDAVTERTASVILQNNLTLAEVCS
jgi:hypothetical protein